MGDMADWSIEQGMDELDAHNRGDCEYGCPYCEPKRKPRVKRKRNTLAMLDRSSEEKP